MLVISLCHKIIKVTTMAENHNHHGHGHIHHHSHENLGKKITLLAITVVLLIIAVMLERNNNMTVLQLFFIYLIPYLLVGYGTLKEALEGIIRGDLFNEHFLMSLATVGALCIGFLPDAETEFTEAVFVMLFFQVGELFEGYAEGKSRDSISHLMDIRPDTANVERGGETVAVSPDEVMIGEVIVIRPSEKVPLDGKIIEGSSSLNTVALTGESMPRFLETGDEVMSGCINLTGVIRVVVNCSFKESTVSKIISLIEKADTRKSRSESFIKRFARVYTPIVVVGALLLAFLPPLFSSAGFIETFSIWLHRALIFLVVSCPCALVISVPLTFFGGLGCASREGILIKGSNYMDVLSRVRTVVFDKTGTLTRGEFVVEAVHTKDFNEKELLYLAAHVEYFSTHPIGKAFRMAFSDEKIDDSIITEVEEFSGHGVKAKVDGYTVYAGNHKLMEYIGVDWHDCHCIGTIVHVAVDGKYVGHIVINDYIKEDSYITISLLKRHGIKKTVMLTGDRKEVASDVAEKLGIDTCSAGLLPDDKVRHIEKLLAEQQSGESLAFVGDGINDAPVLKLADVGIAMGGLGSDAAIEAADVVLMDDKPSKIVKAINISNRTIRIARENVCLAIGIKVAVLGLAIVGIGTMWMAVFADVGVTVLAVFNAMRALRYR